MAKKNMWMALFALVAVLMAVLTTIVSADAPSASASHILVPTEAEVDQLLAEIEAADDLPAKFAELAKSKSKCPSSRNGGALGTFGRGQMVSEFDQVVFEKSVGVVHKVRTQVSAKIPLLPLRLWIQLGSMKVDSCRCYYMTVRWLNCLVRMALGAHDVAHGHGRPRRRGRRRQQDRPLRWCAVSLLA